VTDHRASLLHLSLTVSASGHPRVAPGGEEDEALSGDRAAAIRDAFERGPGFGVLHLGAVEVGTPLPPSFAYYRELGHELALRVSTHPDLETLRDRIHIEAPEHRLEALAAAAPPMTGSEYVTVDSLRDVWRETHDALKFELSASQIPAAEWLLSKNSAWVAVGKVCFHLAENKRDEDAPFAFLATYTTRLSNKGTPQHRPLGAALEESRSKGDKARLLALLLPVQRASEKSALVRRLVESGDIYHPQRWTPREAHAFLKELPLLESAGISVRVPNWWNTKAPPRPQVRVRVGGDPPSQLGTDAVLGFSVDVALGGETLTAAERRAILSSTDGLVLLKGQWVEADGEKLRAVIDQWKEVEQTARTEGLSFHEAMRLLAGASLDERSVPLQSEAARAWSRVEPGPWMKEILDGLRSPETLRATDAHIARGELLASLRAYQKTGIEWLYWAHELGLGVCLADDMGLGKTLQVLTLLLLRRRSKNKGPALLVVPASLVANWKSEAERFCPDLRILIAHSGSVGAAALAAIRSEDVDQADAIITTYGALDRTPWLSERDWGLVVLDEAQAIKNPGAKQTRTVKALRGRTRLALTGTPIENRLGDLWSLFDFLAPGLLGQAKQFKQAAKRMASQDAGYAPLRALVRPYILRRLKTDKRIISDLPDKTEVTAFAGLTRVQAALYQRGVDDLKRALDERDGIKRRGTILASLLRFKQICNHPSQLLGDNVWATDASGKFSRLGEICEPIAARQDKVLVFTQFREMCDPLATYLSQIFGREGLVLHGSVPVKKRKELVDAFQDEAGPPFFVLSLKAGGTGLNLTAASHVIHFDRWWNPAVENQATDRAFRIGQKKNVLVHKFVCRGTIEERIDGLIESKRALFDAVIEGGEELRITELSNEELMSLVRLDLGAALCEEP
jgi:superfamily II DNA or RNA helicase